MTHDEALELDGSHALEYLAAAGMVAGAIGYAASGPMLASPRVYAMSPEQLGTWVGAVCSAAMAVVNTGFVIYHRFKRPGPTRPRKPRRRKPDATTVPGTP